MKKLANLNGAKALNKNEQRAIHGGARGGSSGCCNPTNDCCVPNPYYNGSNCQFVPGDPYTWPVPYCI